jgi:hypothetical protein
MFIGHFGLGLAGKRAAPQVSLGTWFLAVQFLDLLWPLFLLLGWEHVRITPGYTRMSPLDFYHYPVTHSLFGAVGWSVLLAVLYLLATRSRRGRRGQPGRRRTALLLGAGVVSHWVLDLLVHRADLPVLPKIGPYLGFGLWDLPAATLPLELALYGAGIALYLRGTRARDGVGRWGLAALLALLPLLWVGSLYGPPPPDDGVIAWSALALWLLVPWAAWVDRHRAPAGS